MGNVHKVTDRPTKNLFGLFCHFECGIDYIN